MTTSSGIGRSVGSAPERTVTSASRDTEREAGSPAPRADRPAGRTLEQTRALVDAAAEHWLDSRVRGQVPPAIEAELTEAVASYRAAVEWIERVEATMRKAAA